MIGDAVKRVRGFRLSPVTVGHLGSVSSDLDLTQHPCLGRRSCTCPTLAMAESLCVRSAVALAVARGSREAGRWASSKGEEHGSR
jgi:hypothetical protein